MRNVFKTWVMMSMLLACSCIICIPGQSFASDTGMLPPFGQMKPNDLRLIPFPKTMNILPGKFALAKKMTITVSDFESGRQLAARLVNDLSTITKTKCKVKYMPSPINGGPWTLTLSAASVSSVDTRSACYNLSDKTESYRVIVNNRLAVIASSSKQGLVYGTQTLRQLIRANNLDGCIPCVRIDDWPSLEYRGFQDDITRGISPRLDTLKSEAAMSSYMKMNFLTYYMEYQYAFSKHPQLGPKDGSLTPAELTALVKYAKQYEVDIIGCQQSFGHFNGILCHGELKDLRETTWVLDPTNEKSYQFLDDLYSEVAPLTSSKFFNVCCDEVEGLGTGPAKSAVAKYGVGDVYAGHMKRIHDLLQDKYGKRMMMWGDIIRQHPKSLNKIPKDTVMLVWAYYPDDSFEDEIAPFLGTGYDFFVCPGVNCWGRLLPDFDGANINIQNFVRDGVKRGAKGMLNTTWDDTNENFDAFNVYGVAWGAECAWNGSTTSIDDFNRRIGAVLYGEKADHFGQAIELLIKAQREPIMSCMSDSRFWKFDDAHLTSSMKDTIKHANAVINLVNQAEKHLKIAKAEFVSSADYISADNIDYFLFGADRMKLIADRSIRFIDAAKDYAAVQEQPAQASKLLDRASKTLLSIREKHVSMQKRCRKLWTAENKTDNLDNVAARYDVHIKKYDKIIADLDDARNAFETTNKLPDAKALGLDITDTP